VLPLEKGLSARREGLWAAGSPSTDEPTPLAVGDRWGSPTVAARVPGPSVTSRWARGSP